MPILSDSKEAVQMYTLEDFYSDLKKKTVEEQQRYQDLEFYFLELTREVFTDYDLYSTRVIAYKMQRWECKHTHKTGLTYEEALNSERHFEEKNLLKQYPKHITREIVNIVHNNAHPPMKIVDIIFAFFEKFLVPGEEVLFEVDASALAPVRVVRNVTPAVSAPALFSLPSISDLQSSTNQPLPPINAIFGNEQEREAIYEVQFLNENRSAQVPRHLLIRKESPVTKVGLYKWLKENTLRPTETSPYIVHAELYDYLARPDEEVVVEKPAPAPPQIQSVSLKPRQLNSNVFTFVLNDQSFVEKQSTSHKIHSSTPKLDDLHGEHAKKKSKAPVEDLTLAERLPDDPKHDRFWPRPLHFEEVDSRLVGMALMCWNFFYTFRRSFKISSFPFEMFLKELKSKTETPLISKLLRVLVLSLLNDREAGLSHHVDMYAVCRILKKVYMDLTNNKHLKLRYKKNSTSMRIITQTHCSEALKIFLDMNNYFPFNSKRKIDYSASKEEEGTPPIVLSNPIAEPAPVITNGAPEPTPVVNGSTPLNIAPEEQQPTSTVKLESNDSINVVKTESEHLQLINEKPSMSNLLYRWECHPDGFFSLEDEEKILIFQFLIERCSSIYLIRSAIDRYFNQKKSIVRERYMEHIEDLHKHRDELEDIKKVREAMKKAIDTLVQMPDFHIDPNLLLEKQKYDARINELNESERKLANEAKLKKQIREQKYDQQLAQQVIQILCLGTDRHHRKYWFFPGFTGVLFVEYPFETQLPWLTPANDTMDNSQRGQWTRWGFYDSPEQLKALKKSLDEKGIREKRLLQALAANEKSIVRAMQIRKGTAVPEEADDFEYKRDKEDEDAEAVLSRLNELEESESSEEEPPRVEFKMEEEQDVDDEQQQLSEQRNEEKNDDEEPAEEEKAVEEEVQKPAPKKKRTPAKKAKKEKKKKAPKAPRRRVKEEVAGEQPVAPSMQDGESKLTEAPEPVAATPPAAKKRRTTKTSSRTRNDEADFEMKDADTPSAAPSEEQQPTARRSARARKVKTSNEEEDPDQIDELMQDAPEPSPRRASKRKRKEENEDQGADDEFAEEPASKKRRTSSRRKAE